MYAICVRLSVGGCVHVSTAPWKQEVPDSPGEGLDVDVSAEN